MMKIKEIGITNNQQKVVKGSTLTLIFAMDCSLCLGIGLGFSAVFRDLFQWYKPVIFISGIILIGLMLLFLVLRLWEKKHNQKPLSVIELLEMEEQDL